MSLIIDGYNLLHVTGIVGSRMGPATLERARRGLVNFVAASMEQLELAETTIVFDAKDAPPGLPNRYEYGALTVLYAKGYEDADALIEELIETHNAPRQLTVVSSDHRVQRAARRRRATAIDSDVWYGQTIAERRRSHSHSQSQSASTEPRKPATPSESEVEAWLKEFSDIDLADLMAASPTADSRWADQPATSSTGAIGEKSPPAGDEKSGSKKNPKKKPLIDADQFTKEMNDGLTAREKRELSDGYGPFPRGYAEDLLDEEDDAT
jgi:predicted RNA-binding protein with PIN domain